MPTKLHHSAGHDPATIFWLSEPSYYLAYEGEYEQPIKIMELEIIERWRAGLYKSSRFDFGGDYMDEHRDGWVKKFDIPESLADPIEGTEAFPGFEKGFPIEIDVAWYNAMGKEPPDWFLERYDLLWDGEKIVGDVPAADLGQMRLTRPGKMTASEVAGAREALANVRTSFSADDTATRIRALRSKIGEGNETTSEPVNDPRLSPWIMRLFGR